MMEASQCRRDRTPVVLHRIIGGAVTQNTRGCNSDQKGCRK
jgi:hypothetical protein